MRLSPIALWLALAALTTSHAQAADVDCGQPDASAELVLAPWRFPLPGSAATRAADLGQAKLVATRTEVALVRLHPNDQVSFVAPPEQSPNPHGKAGLLTLEVDNAGVYRVALDNKAWIDVVSQGRLVASVGHRPGVICSPIRKIVDFNLAPGRYVLQLSSSDADTVRLQIVLLP